MGASKLPLSLHFPRPEGRFFPPAPLLWKDTAPFPESAFRCHNRFLKTDPGATLHHFSPDFSGAPIFFFSLGLPPPKTFFLRRNSLPRACMAMPNLFFLDRKLFMRQLGGTVGIGFFLFPPFASSKYIIATPGVNLFIGPLLHLHFIGFPFLVELSLQPCPPNDSSPKMDFLPPYCRGQTPQAPFVKAVRPSDFMKCFFPPPPVPRQVPPPLLHGPR